MPRYTNKMIKHSSIREDNIDRAINSMSNKPPDIDDGVVILISGLLSTTTPKLIFSLFNDFNGFIGCYLRYGKPFLGFVLFDSIPNGQSAVNILTLRSTTLLQSLNAVEIVAAVPPMKIEIFNASLPHHQTMIYHGISNTPDLNALPTFSETWMQPKEAGSKPSNTDCDSIDLHLSGWSVDLSPPKKKFRLGDDSATMCKAHVSPNLYVGNLPLGTSHVELASLFYGYPGYIRVSLIRPTLQTKTSHAFIAFTDVASASIAKISLQGFRFSDKEIFILFSFRDQVFTQSTAE